jgi:hypothetical protein
MQGRIKAGEGTLIGNAGEFYVAAELLKRGIIAALAPRNAHSLDIVAAKGTRTARIRVKTKSENYDDWQWSIKKDGSIFRDISLSGDFTVLVNLTAHTKDMAYFVVPTHVLNKWLTDDYDTWVSTPGRNGRPHNPSNKKRHLTYSRHEQDLKPYQGDGAWDSLWKK